MNEKEVAEIRRRFRPGSSGITHFRGCFVNENREIVSQFNQSLGRMSQDDTELILANLRRVLSGKLERNLINIAFSTQQVVDSEEHRLLTALRDSMLKDEEAVQTLFQQIIAALAFEGNYLILLARDAYDIPYRAQDGEALPDASADVFSYLLCSICPVKQTKPALSYAAERSELGHLGVDWVVSAPEVGFLFPAFDNRTTNLYGTLYYTKDVTQVQSALIDTLFRVEPPMPADAQKEAFQAVLKDALLDECSYEVVQAVQDELCGMMAEHKESREEEPLRITKGTVKRVLCASGVSQERADAFETCFDAAFGGEASISPQNIVDSKQTELRTPDVRIQVSPERGDLIQTRVIDGVNYILVRADEGVEVNGVDVHMEGHNPCFA